MADVSSERDLPVSAFPDLMLLAARKDFMVTVRAPLPCLFVNVIRLDSAFAARPDPCVLISALLALLLGKDSTGSTATAGGYGLTTAFITRVGLRC